MHKFKEIISGKRVFLLGSAPGAEIPGASDDIDVVIAVNGSMTAFTDLIPDVLFINGWTLKDGKGIAPKSRDGWNGRHARHVVFIETAVGLNVAIPELKEFGLTWDSIELMTRQERFDVSTEASGLPFGIDKTALYEGAPCPSTGVSVMCAALVYGAKSLLVSGISLVDGHNYGDMTFKRGHIDADTKTLSAISGRFSMLPRQSAAKEGTQHG